MRAITALCAIVALGLVVGDASMASPATTEIGQVSERCSDAHQALLMGGEAEAGTRQSPAMVLAEAQCTGKWEACDVADGTQRNCCQGLICREEAEGGPKCFQRDVRPECISEEQSCKSDRDGCCPGLSCQEVSDDYSGEVDAWWCVGDRPPE